MIDLNSVVFEESRDLDFEYPITGNNFSSDLRVATFKTVSEFGCFSREKFINPS